MAALSTVAQHPLITGNGLAARCREVINYGEVEVNEGVENNWWFCRTDFIEHFFAEHEPAQEYVLFSHNSDRPVDAELRRFLRRSKLRAWFAVNAAIDHPKLHAFPIGIANPHWAHGDGSALVRIRSQGLEKRDLFDASYDVATYPHSREYCREQTGIEPSRRRDFEEYLEGLAAAYFCIAPRGHGIDTHRVWEALYLRTVPVVTRSVVTEQHPDLPMVVLDDWSHFRLVEFSPELYARTMGDWTSRSIELDPYLERVREVIEGAE